MDRRAIYTVITGNYDTLKEPFVKSEGWDYICFTDDPSLISDTWEIRLIDTTISNQYPDKQRLQRHIKLLAYVHLNEYRFTIYIDGSTQQLLDFNWLLQEINYTGGIALKRHSKRNCIYEEVAACVKLNKDARTVLLKQMETYANIYKYPMNGGLYESGILIRENIMEVNLLCEHWHTELMQHSVRDQISLPFVLWRYPPKCDVKIVEYDTVQKYINIKPHVSSHVVKPHICYIQPYASDKNIGKEYNYHCDKVAENDWICILDHDVMFLHPETKKQIEEIVQTQGKAWDLLGAVTNRIASAHQCAYNTFSDNPNILDHYNTACELHTSNYGDVKMTLKGIAGFLMLMPKKTWTKLKFIENNIAFDTDFSRRLLRKGGKIGVMTGVYVFHYYRFHAENPTQFKEHLI